MAIENMSRIDNGRIAQVSEKAVSASKSSAVSEENSATFKHNSASKVGERAFTESMIKHKLRTKFEAKNSAGTKPKVDESHRAKALQVYTCTRKDVPVSQQKASSCELMPLSKGGKAGGTTKRGEAAMYGVDRRNGLELRVEQGSSIVGNTAKGVVADQTLPRRYRLEPQRGDTVTGIRDTSAGKVRGIPPKPVGAPVIRLDTPHAKTPYPHVNINPSLTGVPDPHTRISPTTLKVAGGAARTLEAFGKVARPVAIITDTVRLGVAVHADGGTIGKSTAVTAGSVAGGWAGAVAGGLAGAKGGAAVGAAVGALFGGFGAVPGAAVGGFLGGLAGSIGGAFVGAAAGEAVAKAAVRKIGSK